VKLAVALVNMKPGTAKTTSATWLATAFAERFPTLGVDADPAASMLQWADLAADEGGCPFRVVAMPSPKLHTRVPDIARPDEVVIMDVPQIEDHKPIAHSAMRLADEILIPVAPTPIELNRTAPVQDEIEAVEPSRLTKSRAAALLNRVVANTNSARNARDILAEDIGFDVLATSIPRQETYAQSFGMVPAAGGLALWRDVVSEILVRAGLGTAQDQATVAALQERVKREKARAQARQSA
jgi:chromosome partitioning protein